jgi:hypothetical protein
VIATPWLRLEAPIDAVRARLSSSGGRLATPGEINGAGARGSLVGSLAARAVIAYRSVISIPDSQAGWIRPALRAGRELSRHWTPDLIYSTALPFSSHVVAARLARATQRPWVGEYRDLFTGNPYSDLWRLRNRLDESIERRVMASASAIVAVTPEMTENLARFHGKPSATVLNGFDPADLAAAPDLSGELDRTKVNIVYTGIIYPGRRDPTVLLEALRRLGPDRHRFEVRFYGHSLEPAAEAARRLGVDDVVRIGKPVPYLSSLGLQKAADILLLLLWDSPLERGVLTGKIFEYAGAGRPVLSLGCEDGAAAALVRNRRLGIATTDPDRVRAFLVEAEAQKSSTGRVDPPGGPETKVGLSRREQFETLERFLSDHRLLAPTPSHV